MLFREDIPSLEPTRIIRALLPNGRMGLFSFVDFIILEEDKHERVTKGQILLKELKPKGKYLAEVITFGEWNRYDLDDYLNEESIPVVITKRKEVEDGFTRMVE